MNWLATLLPAEDALGTSAITELGFVRVSVQSALQPDIAAAQQALARMKASSPVPFELWADAVGVDRLPAYVRKPAELTDGLSWYWPGRMAPYWWPSMSASRVRS